MAKEQKSILEKFATDFYLERVFPAIREEKTQRYITLALTLLAISFFGFFAISPTLSTIAELQKQLSDNQLVDRSLQQKITNLSVLEQQYNVIQPNLPSVFTALPQNPQSPLLLASIQALASEHHLTLSRIDAGTMRVAPIAGSQNGDNAFDFSVDVSGNQNDILAFMKSVANFNRVVTIESLTLGAQKTGTNPGATLDLKGKAHFKPS